MSICTNFEGALMKAIRSLEQHTDSLLSYDFSNLSDEEFLTQLALVDDLRVWRIAEAVRRHLPYEQIHADFTSVPMSVCSAMSQGYIGYDLQNAIRAEYITRGIAKPVSTVLTQVLVDPYDEAFYEPSKVIGRTLTKEEAEHEEQKGNFVTKTKDGWRRIVASPVPKDIIEIETVKTLVNAGQTVICCGGGGIPVMSSNVPTAMYR